MYLFGWKQALKPYQTQLLSEIIGFDAGRMRVKCEICTASAERAELCGGLPLRRRGNVALTVGVVLEV